MKQIFAAVMAVACASTAHGQAQDIPPDQEEASEDIVVQATRGGRRVQDEPIRVEVLGRAEIEEKLLMRPGNIAMLVKETGGVRLQATSPALARPMSAFRAWRGATRSCSPTACRSTVGRRRRWGCSRSRPPISDRSR